MSGAGTEAKS